MAYHPQANGIVERRIKEVKIHLRALVYENRARDVWSQYLETSGIALDGQSRVEEKLKTISFDSEKVKQCT